jgi:hypothetical protein
MLMKVLEFHPSATGRVRLIVTLLMTGSVLEAILTFATRWPTASGPLELWQAVVSPVIWLGMGFAFAGALARLTRWVYWLAVMLWVRSSGHSAHRLRIFRRGFLPRWDTHVSAATWGHLCYL